MEDTLRLELSKQYIGLFGKIHTIKTKCFVPLIIPNLIQAQTSTLQIAKHKMPQIAVMNRHYRRTSNIQFTFII